MRRRSLSCSIMAAPRSLLIDREFSAVIDRGAGADERAEPLVIDIDDAVVSRAASRIGEIEYEAARRARRSGLRGDRRPATNGTRSRSTTPRARPAIPRASSTHHRGAYLNAVGNMLAWHMPAASGLSLDAADVPLQRLVLSLDGRGSAPAPTSACAGSRPKRSSTRSATRRDAHVRRADRVYDADQCTRCARAAQRAGSSA